MQTSIQDEIKCAMLEGIRHDNGEHEYFAVFAFLIDENNLYLSGFNAVHHIRVWPDRGNLEQIMNDIVDPSTKHLCREFEHAKLDTRLVNKCDVRVVFASNQDELKTKVDVIDKDIHERYTFIDEEENLEIVLKPTFPGELDRWSIINRRMGKCPFDDALTKFLFFYNRQILPSYPEDDLWKKTPWGQNESSK